MLVRRDKVQWATASPSWEEAGLPAPTLVGEPLPEGSAAFRDPADFMERESAVTAWLPRQAWRRESIFESTRSTRFGRLVLLVAEAA